MKKALTKQKELYHYVNGGKIDGVHDNITGDTSNISGDVSNISGDVSYISGDLDDCDITEEEREKGINVKDLVK